MKEKNRIKHRSLRRSGLFLIGMIVCTLVLWPFNSEANGIFYQNPDTGMQASVLDDANYLTDEEEQALLVKMKPITAYANVVYLTDENNLEYSERYSEALCTRTMEKMFGSDPAVIYLVDNEYDYIKAQGGAESRINDTKAYNITDDVYMLSAKGKYYEGAVKAFSEIEKLLAGKAVISPVQLICNAFLALFLAFVVNYAIMKGAVKLKQPSLEEVIEGSYSSAAVGLPNAVFTHQTKVYSPRSKSSGGGHGGGGGGGHGGGHSH